MASTSPLERHSQNLVPLTGSKTSAELATGSWVGGKYRIANLLGYWGGLGRVYQAQQERVDRVVALKVLRQRLVSHRESVSAFIDTSLRLSGTGHPNLVSVYDFGEAPGGGLYMAMEYLEGVTLQAVLSHVGRMSADATIEVLRQIAAALAIAHQMGLCHRDLKPTNIFITQTAAYGDVVKVMDFSMASLLGRSHENHRSGHAHVCGTPEYMAPETSRLGTYDARSDVYALGCIAYQMLAGRLPYHSHNAMQTALLHQVSEVPEVSHSDMPAPYAELIRRMMSKRPSDRPANGQEVVDGLRKAEEEVLSCYSDATEAWDQAPLSFLETQMWARDFDPDTLPRGEEAGDQHPCEAGPTYVFPPEVLDALRSERAAADADSGPVFVEPEPRTAPPMHVQRVAASRTRTAAAQAPAPQGVSPTLMITIVTITIFCMAILVALVALAVLVLT